jgi:hypothetical protein
MRLLLLSISIFYASSCFSQKKDTVCTFCLYGEFCAGGGTGGNIAPVVNVLFLHNNIVSAGFYYYWHRANVPPGFTRTRFMSEKSDGILRYSLDMATLMYGKILFFPYTEKVRVSLKAGLAIGASRTPENFVRKQGAPYGVYYDLDNVYHTAGGAILNPSIEFPLTYGLGFRLGVTAIINNYSNIFEAEGSVLFGKLRPGRPKYTRSERRQRMAEVIKRKE